MTVSQSHLEYENDIGMSFYSLQSNVQPPNIAEQYVVCSIITLLFPYD